MRVNDVFSRIHDRQIEGVMLHHALGMYFEFVGLSGFAEMQNERMKNEDACMVKLEKYFIKHYNMLLNPNELTIREYAPEKWYELDRFDFGKTDKEDAVKSFVEMWVEWESASKKTFEIAFGDLNDLREFAGAMFVKKIVCEVDYELAFAEELYLELMGVNFDFMRVQEIDDLVCEKYKCFKERKVKKDEYKSE